VKHDIVKLPTRKKTYASARVLKKTCKKQYSTDAIPSGSDRSTTSSSLPNRVSSWPLGVDEKKLIGAPNTDLSIALCIVVEMSEDTLR
jgi:hypothetical protein